MTRVGEAARHDGPMTAADPPDPPPGDPATGNSATGDPATGDPATDDRISIRSLTKGALVGLSILVPVSIVIAILRHETADFDNSGWIYPLFLLVLVGYAAAGWVAARLQPGAPLTHGILGAVGALVLWIPLRIVIWALREDDRKLFSGDDAALAPGQLFGQFVIAAGIGLLVGWLSERFRRPEASEPAT